ncbi:trichohyalin isoform X3 [Hypomesus transpacificus]|uniref:trichohyalin isoform X3 n=1 Tax=Hypomesus transpacificus TaxID=137520 RepID=UPI001F07470F|nr:trichohyalin isoform X3 [Hypomesus transpacificus]
MERERERRREEKRWREQEMNRLMVRTGKRGKETDRTESYGEGDRVPGPRWRETEREQRERDGRGGDGHPRGRPNSHYEFGPAREPETNRGKGDTFPRMRTKSKDRGRGMSPFIEEEEAGDAGRQRERLREMEVNDKESDRERAARRGGQRGGERDQWHREEQSRDKERGGVRVRAREEGEKNGGRPMEDGLPRQRERQRQSDSDVRERRRERDSEGNDLWSRGANGASREGPNPRQREREGRYYSPQTRRERNGENHSDRDHRERRDKMRDIKSEGDSDGERTRENVRNDRREEQRYHHSRSEGDNGSLARDRLTETERERQRWREEERKAYSERGGGRDTDRHRDREKYREGDRRERRDWGVERELERQRDAGRERPSGRPEERRRQRDPEWERAQAHVPGERGKRRERERERGSHPDRKEEDDDRMFRERRNRERDPTMEGVANRISRSPSETVRRGPPRATSSGEWSSDMEGDRRWRKDRERPGGKESEKESVAENERDEEEERRRRTRYKDTAQGDRPDRERDGEEEKKSTRSEQRKMWLEPQRGKHSNNSSVEEEFMERKRCGEENRRLQSEEKSLTEREGRALVERERRRGREKLRGEGGKARAMETEGLNVDRAEEWEGRGGTDRGEEEPLRCGDDTREERGHREEDDKHGSDGEEEGGSDRCTRRESEGGSEREGEEERERAHSLAEDGFITVSSGGDEEDEREEFEDCKEFWEGGVACDVPREAVGYKGCEGEMPLSGERERTGKWTEKAEVAVEGGGEERTEKRKEENSTYVFCLIGQTLPRSRPNRMSAQEQMEGEETNQNPGNEQHGTANEMGDPQHNDSYQDAQNERQEDGDDLHAPNQERTWVGDSHRASDPSKAEERGERGGVEAELENPYAEITLRRDLTTEALLKEWRERNTASPRQTESDREPSSHITSGPAAEAPRPGAPVSDGATLGGLSPDEQVALRIRMSGAWSLEEEAKRHSQAPHLKWAKNVVSEILGSSEDPGRDDPRAGLRAGGPAAEGGRASPVYSTIWKVGVPGRDSGAEPDQREAELRGAEEVGDEDNDEMHLSWGEADLRNATDRTTRTRRRNSKFFIDAQLYQQYSETAQNREIRQSRSDVLSASEDLPVSPAPVPPSSPAPSPASSPPPSPTPARRPLPPLPTVPHPHSLSHSGSFSSISSTVSAKSLPLPLPPHADGRPSSPRLSISLTSSPTLWQDLPGVRDSVGLAEVTDDQRRLQEVRFEVITSEASYCRSLDIVVEHFVKSKQLGALLTTQDRNWLFSRLADVRTISHRFLSKLEERVESDLLHFTVCDIIARHCQHFKMVYVPYLTNQSYQDATYQRLMEENAGFKRVVDKLERSSVCQRLPLRSFLILPFQRITRIKLLVQNIVKRIAPGTDEELHAIRAMKLLGKLIQESNDSITQMKSIESLVSLSAKVDFECRTLPLVSQSRRLVREGPATELMDFSLKETERSVYLHLFNDYLLLSLHKDGGRFTVIDHAPVSELRGENCRVKLHSLQKNLFRLHMSSKSLLLRSDTQSNKLRWISALSRPHPVIDFSAAQDFTQMQCIRAFVAQQPDGLSLEKADVILVHQQSSDGWVEGTRLSDRQRGWAPESHLETITSPRAQQRNLLDALKITTATAAV